MTQKHKKRWFELYTGQAPSWYLVRHLSGDNACRIFGITIGRFWIGMLWDTKRVGITPEEIDRINTARQGAHP